VVGIDPRLVDPVHGDYRPELSSPAVAYGCQTFASGGARPSAGTVAPLTVLGNRAGGMLGARSSVEVSGAIATDTFWDADTVRVVGNVDVENGVTLDVAPGTRVEFADFYSLSVHGRILAIGTPEYPNVFTTDEPGAFAVDTTDAGCWNGIRFPWTSSTNLESRLEHCVLEYSKALGDEAFGGALSVVGFSKLLVRNSVVRSCVADYGGAVFCSHQAAPSFVGSLFEGNFAFTAGAAIYDLYAYPGVTNCTVVSNTVLNEEPFDATGTIHNHISKPRMTGSIVRANSNAFFIPTELLDSKAYYTTFTNVEGGHEGEGNVDDDPVFLGSGDHPYALGLGSPCLDAGNPDTLGLRLPPVDLAGHARLDGGRVDMGSYEGPGGTGVEDEPTLDERLLRACPNPFRDGTTIVGGLPARSRITVRVYDVAGRKVRTLRDGVADAGLLEISWDGTDGEGRALPSGVYFVRVDTGLRAASTTKLVLLR